MELMRKLELLRYSEKSFRVEHSTNYTSPDQSKPKGDDYVDMSFETVSEDEENDHPVHKSFKNSGKTLIQENSLPLQDRYNTQMSSFNHFNKQNINQMYNAQMLCQIDQRVKDQIYWQSCNGVSSNSTSPKNYSFPSMCDCAIPTVNAERCINIKEKEQVEYEEIENMVLGDYNTCQMPRSEFVYEAKQKKLRKSLNEEKQPDNREFDSRNLQCECCNMNELSSICENTEEEICTPERKLVFSTSSLNNGNKLSNKLFRNLPSLFT